ncbi:unnamed protein product [Rhizoctonia solani]|uniref:CID domain-containing protein n=1 Tax=Rhizoctonia solani TaxID=456999 RepID=A0A8H3CU78_9AGAM|nr:unnamed protein product [Rhizoctonia solani]
MNSSGLAEFETQLKTVVTSKRLSSSKMAALTELAVENMHLDTQMISLMYRTHKGLPTVNKISSLYVFDSVARAAHRTKSKRGLVADLNSTGNAASFLVRLEGMLDGLVEDMLANGPPEAKEKCRKVLDIWTREGTFPAGALKRLSERVSGSSPVVQGAYNVHYMLLSLAIHWLCPRGHPQSHTPPTPATPSSAIASLPPGILALLGTPTQPPPPQPFTLDPSQLALISQLTAAHSQSATPPFSPARNARALPAILPVASPAPTGSFSPTAPPYSPVRKESAPPGGAPSFERSRSASPTRRQDKRFEDRGLNSEPSRRRFEDRTTDPRRRSRSPRRSLPGKDEFGRDLRASRSPVQVPVHPTSQPLQSYPPAQPQAAQGGLDTFDMSMFNPADATAWTNLATAWQVTNGRGPTQEEMMMFVMGGNASQAAGAGRGDASGRGQGQGQGRGRGRGRGFRGRARARGRGAFGGEPYGGHGEYGGDPAFGGSDAVVLGGGDDTEGYQDGHAQPYEHEQAYGGDLGGHDSTPTSGGGMKKINGKWVWTKN